MKTLPLLLLLALPVAAAAFPAPRWGPPVGEYHLVWNGACYRAVFDGHGGYRWETERPDDWDDCWTQGAYRLNADGSLTVNELGRDYRWRLAPTVDGYVGTARAEPREWDPSPEAFRVVLRR